MGLAPASVATPPLDVRAMLDATLDQTLTLHEAHINPAYAGVLRTIGFDQKWARGEGAYLWDDKGERYIDCLGGYAVFNVGRNHPVVRDALRQAMDLDLPNLLGIGAFRVSGLLAKELLAIAPGDALTKVFFCSAGTEANEAAIKFARAATGRARIVYCHRSYHGLSMGSLSVTGNSEFREGFGPLLADTTEVPFNDPAALERELARGDVAAFIVEPIQGKGVNLPADEYLREASRLCHLHGAKLILDEIQTGLGRTGRWFACEHFGAGVDWQPDLITIAKGLSGGYVPVAAVLMTERVNASVFSSMSNCSRIQTTFGQNDLAMVAGLAALHVLKHERIIENAASVGEHLMSGLRRVLGGFEMVKAVRGKGLMIGIEFQRPASMMLRMGWDALHKLDASLFCQAIIMPLMSDHRVIAQVAGHRLDVIKLIPPLVLSREDADEVVAAFAACVGACHQFPGPAWEVGKKLSGAAMKRFVTS
ncbi:MAG: aspartate aminotransferase family protein [Phycisphaerales bacterium]